MPTTHTRGEILVVDDEPTIGEVVSRYLERAGYATRVAGDGDRALALHGERAADLGGSFAIESEAPSPS